MALSDFAHKRKTILFDGGEFEVRAISLPDVAGLVTRNQDSIDRVAALIEAQKIVYGSGDVSVSETRVGAELILSLIRESPFLVADLISCCAEEPNGWEAAYNLPLPVQVEALQAIADLTFADAMALKKFIADVSVLFRGMLPTPTVTAAQ